MSEPRMLHYSEPVLRDPVAIIGFPTVGLVGSILTGQMIRDHKLPVVAGITAPDFPPYTFIMEGRPYPQIRILAGTPIRRKKKKDASKNVDEAADEKVSPPKKRSKPHDLVIVTSEITPKPEQTYDVAMTVLRSLKDMGVNDVICLDGAVESGNDVPIVGVAGNDYCKKMLESAEIKVMNDGLVRGTSGIFLMEGGFMDMNVMALLVPANTQIPDPRASARLLEPIARMYPRFETDPEPLIKEAEDIENRVQAQQAQQNSPSALYG